MKKVLIYLIDLYQGTLSLDHGWLSRFYPYGYCKFKPTCSEYSKNAIEKHGVFKGGGLAFYRVLRCNPWSQGGEDSVV